LNGIFNTEIVINAYKLGYFPMADSREGEIYWHSPEWRAVFPLHKIETDKSTIKKIRRGIFTFSFNNNFELIVNSCANRAETWISNDIIDTYTELHHLGFAHSIETWMDGEIVGGLYGVAIGGAFFGESMFNTKNDAAKAAFYMLIRRLEERDFLLLDSQYINNFTRQLGAEEIAKKKYLKILEKAISLVRNFD